MKTRMWAILLAVVCTAIVGRAQSDWQRKVQQELPLLGHRNWIVIVDSAYPLQSSPGIETVSTGEDQLAVVNYVLKAVAGSPHVRAIVHTDEELRFVPEQEAPGVDQYRKELKSRLAGLPTDSIPHDALIAKLKETSDSFHILILKTRMTIPYTSVFLQLDCRYWSAESEARLRQVMKRVQGH